MRLVGKTPVEAAGIDTTGWKSLLEESVDHCGLGFSQAL